MNHSARVAANAPATKAGQIHFLTKIMHPSPIMHLLAVNSGHPSISPDRPSVLGASSPYSERPCAAVKRVRSNG